MKIVEGIAIFGAVAVGSAHGVYRSDTSLPEYCGRDPVIPPLHTEGIVDEPKLVQVTVLARHGDRTQWNPRKCWKGDIAEYSCGQNTHFAHTDQTTLGNGEVAPRLFRQAYIKGRTDIPGDCIVGQLTKKGYQQEIANGRAFLKAYSVDTPFLPGSYEENPDFFLFRSDDNPRTMKSGQAIVEGMYPVTEVNHNYDVIPWHMTEYDLDDINPNSKICPGLTAETAKVEAQAVFADHMDKITIPLLEDLSHLTGEDFTKEMGIDRGIDCFYTHVCNGFGTPDYLPESFLDNLVIEAEWKNQYLLNIENGDVAALQTGLLMEEIYNNMILARSGDIGAVPFTLFAGHDTGPIMPILAALKMFSGKWARYGSLITLELYEAGSTGEAKTNFVRVIYNNEVMKIGDCSSELCPWEEFSAIMEKVVYTAKSKCFGTTK